MQTMCVRNCLAASVASFTALGKFFSTEVWEEPKNEATHPALWFDYKYIASHSLGWDASESNELLQASYFYRRVQPDSCMFAISGGEV